MDAINTVSPAVINDAALELVRGIVGALAIGKIEAIKAARMNTGLGLKEAKDLIEDLLDNAKAHIPTPVKNDDYGSFLVLAREPVKHKDGRDRFVQVSSESGRYYAMSDAKNFQMDYEDIRVVRVIAKTKRTIEEI